MLICAAWLGGAWAQGADEATAEEAAEPPPLEDARALISASIATLPREPLSLSGLLTVRRKRGQVLKEVPYGIRLDWGAEPPRADYELRDGFGRVIERLTVLRRGAAAELQLVDGQGAFTTNAPSLSARVQGTDITWLDLTLDFLWWPDARLDGQEDVRGRACDVVVVAPPAPIPGCSGVRLWLDRRLHFLMQAEQLGPQGEPVRRMWVHSVRKVDTRWIIRDMEIENLHSDHRTRLRVDDVGEP